MQKGQKPGVTLVQKGKGQESILKVVFLFVGTQALEVYLKNSKLFSRMANNNMVFCPWHFHDGLVIAAPPMPSEHWKNAVENQEQAFGMRCSQNHFSMTPQPHSPLPAPTPSHLPC